MRSAAVAEKRRFIICIYYLSSVSQCYKSVRITSHLSRSLCACNYRAMMHHSAKRGLAIACRPSVRPPVTLVDCDHIGWKSWKLIARTISPTANTFAVCSPKAIHLLPGEHGEISGRLTEFYNIGIRRCVPVVTER